MDKRGDELCLQTSCAQNWSAPQATYATSFNARSSVLTTHWTYFLLVTSVPLKETCRSQLELCLLNTKSSVCTDRQRGGWQSIWSKKWQNCPWVQFWPILPSWAVRRPRWKTREKLSVPALARPPWKWPKLNRRAFHQYYSQRRSERNLHLRNTQSVDTFVSEYLVGLHEYLRKDGRMWKDHQLPAWLIQKQSEGNRMWE